MSVSIIFHFRQEENFYLQFMIINLRRTSFRSVFKYLALFATKKHAFCSIYKVIKYAFVHILKKLLFIYKSQRHVISFHYIIFISNRELNIHTYCMYSTRIYLFMFSLFFFFLKNNIL
jgi:hypothetical protein